MVYNIIRKPFYNFRKFKITEINLWRKNNKKWMNRYAAANQIQNRSSPFCHRPTVERNYGYTLRRRKRRFVFGRLGTHLHVQ